MKISARNVFKDRNVAVTKGTTTAHVKIDCRRHCRTLGHHHQCGGGQFEA